MTRDTKPTRVRSTFWDPLAVVPAFQVWLWAVLALLTTLQLGPDFIGALRPAPTEGVDFFQEWASARNFLDKRPVYMDLREAARIHLGYTVAPDETIFISRNAHPPTSILLALPVAVLPYPDAMLAWNLISLAALTVSGWLIVRCLRLEPPRWVIFPAITVGLLCDPLQQQVRQGQLNLVLLALITIMWASTLSERWSIAGSALGLATAIKLFPGFFFVYYVLLGRWKVVVYGAVALAIATLVTVAVLGTDAYQSYLTLVVPQVATFRNWWSNVSLAGFWTMWFDTGAVSTVQDPMLPTSLPPAAYLPRVAIIGLAATSFAVLALWTRHLFAAGSSITAPFCLTAIAMLLLSPISWAHYFLLLLLPLTYLWITLSSHRRLRGILLAIVVCMWANPVAIWKLFIPPDGRPAVWSLTIVSFQFFALIALFVLAIAADRRPPEAPRISEPSR